MNGNGTNNHDANGDSSENEHNEQGENLPDY